MKDTRGREEIRRQPGYSRPRRTVLLTPSPQRTPPENLHVVQERTQTVDIGILVGTAWYAKYPRTTCANHFPWAGIGSCIRRRSSTLRAFSFARIRWPPASMRIHLPLSTRLAYGETMRLWRAPTAARPGNRKALLQRRSCQNHKTTLTLTSSKTTSAGVVVLTYQPAGKNPGTAVSEKE